MKYLFIVIAVFLYIPSDGQPGNEIARLTTYGVRINVPDMKKALQFYRGILGFQVRRASLDSNTVILQPATGDDRIILKKVNYLLPQQENESGACLTLQVNNLDSSIESLKEKGIDLTRQSIRKEGVGYAIYIYDPFGTRISLMHETVVKNAAFNEPRIYNYGFYIPDMQKGRQFFTRQLGFTERTLNYLPLDLPLGHKSGSFAFMLHTRDNIKSIRYNSTDNEPVVILFQTKDIQRLIAEMSVQKILTKKMTEDPVTGRAVSFYDPFGYLSEVIEAR